MDLTPEAETKGVNSEDMGEVHFEGSEEGGNKKALFFWFPQA